MTDRGPSQWPNEDETEVVRVPPRSDAVDDEPATVSVDGERGTADVGPGRGGEKAGPHSSGAASERPRGSPRDLIMAARLQAQHRSGPMVRGAPGGQIPGYRILRELHRGGQGVVYLAVQEGTRREVAIKVMLHGGFAGPHDKVRFEREIQVLAQLNNPNIVAIHDSGQAGEHVFYVMDYVAGPTLDDFVDSTRPGVRETLELFVVVCHAVNAAHLRGVIHRDLKPSNIRVTPSGSPQILDFGLAKVDGVAEAGQTLPTQMTKTGQFIGSLPWASPEQARGESAKIDVRTDVYALGVILYQLLCGRFPYNVDGPMGEVLDNIITRDPDRPRSVTKAVDAEVEAIVLKALEKHRERRYQSAGELARDIERYLAGEAIEARRWNKRYVVAKFLKRNRAAAIGAGLTFLVVPVGAVVATTVVVGRDAENFGTAMELRQLRDTNAALGDQLRAAREHGDDLERRFVESQERVRALEAELERMSGLLTDP